MNILHTEGVIACRLSSESSLENRIKVHGSKLKLEKRRIVQTKSSTSNAFRNNSNQYQCDYHTGCVPFSSFLSDQS